MLEGIRMIVLLVSLFLCAWIDWKTERVSVPLLLLGGMAAVLLHLFAQEESVFYLMTGMSVGIALLLYSLVTHESIGYGDGCLFVMTGLFLGIWENLVLLLLASVLAGIGSAVLLFLRKRRKGKNTVCTICIYGVCFIVTLMEGAGYAGKFSIEASLIVPLVLAVMVLALRTGIDCYEETKAQVAKLGTRVSFDIVDTMYLLDEITDIGDLFHGD